MRGEDIEVSLPHDLPAGGAQSFLTITPAVNVKSVAIANGKLVITYQ